MNAPTDAQTDPPDTKLIDALKQHWQDEMRSACTYREMATHESDDNRKRILSALAEAEEKHAARFEDRIHSLGSSLPDYTSFRPMHALALKVGPPETVLVRMEEAEDAAASAYEDLLHAAEGDVDTTSLLKEVQSEERVHSRTLRMLAGPQSPRSRLDLILRRERWHTRGDSWIGDAIYGVNDGLGAVFGIVSGMAGYTGGGHYIVAAGLAGLLASALSMGSGAYLAAKSRREISEAELDRERREIEEHPAEEREELELFYQLKGLTAEEAQLLAGRLQDRPEEFLKTLAHEELGISQVSLPDPYKALLTAALSTALGAFIPIVPFFFTTGLTALILSASVSIAAHFAVGAAKSIVTTRSWWKSGAEMTAVGLVEAIVTYGLGVAFGAMI